MYTTVLNRRYLTQIYLSTSQIYVTHKLFNVTIMLQPAKPTSQRAALHVCAKAAAVGQDAWQGIQRCHSHHTLPSEPLSHLRVAIRKCGNGADLFRARLSKLWLQTVVINKVLLAHSHVPSFINWFMAEFSSCTPKRLTMGAFTERVCPLLVENTGSQFWLQTQIILGAL